MSNRFLQIHFLTSYPGSLLNRDDAGFAKRMPFGGVSRTRISSQCLKRHWRTFDGEHALARLGAPESIRSRRTFEKYVLTPLLSEFDGPVARAATEALIATVLGESAKAKKAKSKSGADEGTEVASAQTGQVTVLGRPEVDYLLSVARQVCADAEGPKDVAKRVKDRLDREARKNLEAIRLAAGLDAALFGRMVTGDILSRGDAAVHVAHAFTVHEEASEADYFSAVDDLAVRDEELGSGHIGSTELTSGLFYGYVVLDVPLLVSNLEGCRRADWASADRALAGRVASSLVHLVATVSPGAKLGSTAPYSCAHLVLVESGNAQPRTLANAFLEPVREAPGLLRRAYSALGAHLADLDAMYGACGERLVALQEPADELLSKVPIHRVPSLSELAGWVEGRVGGSHA